MKILAYCWLAIAFGFACAAAIIAFAAILSAATQGSKTAQAGLITLGLFFSVYVVVRVTIWACEKVDL